jgi:hypothetical protein
MGYSSGHKWTDNDIRRIREMRLAGKTMPEIAKILSLEFWESITPNMVESISKRRGRLLDDNLMVESDPMYYDSPKLPMDNYIVMCDVHSPAHSEMWINRALSVADKFGIKKNIIVGDLFDFEFARMQKSEERPPSFDEEKEKVVPIIKALDYFDLNYLVNGNHERRIGIHTMGMLEANHIFGAIGGDTWIKKFKTTKYDKMEIGDEWLVVHPKSYSQIGGNVAVKLANKYQKNVLNAHGHFVAIRFDISGKHMGIDLGGMFDLRKVGYKNLMTTTHPEWNPGFGMFLDGWFFHFHERTNFNFWLDLNLDRVRK